MKNSRTSTHGRSAVAWLLVIAVASATLLPSAAAQEKLRAEEIVAKHLEAIGAAGARASVKNRIAVGKVAANFRSPVAARFDGRVVMASEGSKSLLGMSFENSNYSQEKFGFDGREVTVGYQRPGVRSNLSEFILTHKDILKQGLLGGALSTAWTLLGLSEKKAKLESSGTKRIGGRPAYELKYLPRGGSDLQISLFFDAENFRHLRTEYTRLISAQLGGSIDASAGQRATRYKMVEEFADFAEEGGLILPHTYTLQLELDTRGGTYAAEWKMSLSQFAFNQPVGPGAFDVNAIP